MKKTLLSALMLSTLSLAGCGGDDDETPTPPGDNKPKLDSQTNILTYLEGKTLLMEGANIPSHPLALDEDINWGSASQCFQKVTITVGGGSMHVRSIPGTIRNSTGIGQPGSVCDHDAPGSTLEFDSKNIAITNAAADGSCFDILVDYGSFKQEGRAKFTSDAKQIHMELYFETRATGWHCADGAVGAKTVTNNGVAVTNNTVQVYDISG